MSAGNFGGGGLNIFFGAENARLQTIEKSPEIPRKKK